GAVRLRRAYSGAARARRHPPPSPPPRGARHLRLPEPHPHTPPCRREAPAPPGDGSLDLTSPGAAPLVANGVPVVALVGSCMNAGKTAAACALVRELTHAGLEGDGAQNTGVSLRRDVLAMEDAGARRTALFTDLGVVSTTAKNAAAVTRTLITRLAAAPAPGARVGGVGAGGGGRLG